MAVPAQTPDIGLIQLGRKSLERPPEDHVGLDTVTRLAFASCDLTQEQADDVRFGRTLTSIDLGAPGQVALFDPAGTFLALYEQRGATARPVSVFV